MTRPLPRAPGTYVLWLPLATLTTLTIGRLGRFEFPAGCYAYVGSAQGAGGLAGRLKHHLAQAARPHWHIDYLRAAAPVAEIWCCAGSEAREHDWAGALHQLPGAQIIAPRFGASDCRCPSHLLYFGAMPELAAFSERAGGVIERVRPG